VAALTKTYTRTVYRFFTREELADLLKWAHEECKKEVPLTVHKLKGKRARTVVTRKRDEYLACIRNKILSKLKERVPSGARVEIPEYR
jgi:hypothetical protein